MRSSGRTLLLSGLVALVSQAAAQVASVCPSTGVCFKLNIPESTTSSGSGDIFFQISAPSTYSWVALGQGRAMSGSNMFVVYTSADGNNVTLSPRSASGYNMPTLNSAAQVELLEGSSVSNGVMTANVKCSNCNSWSGGTADFTASSGNWIYAYLASGGALNTNDQSASIRQHSQYDSFSWDYANAKGGSSVNPLVNAAPAGTGTATGTGGGSGSSATSSCIPRQGAQATGASGSGTTTAASPTQTLGDDGNDDNTQRGRPTWATARPSSWPTGRPWNNDDDGTPGRFVKRQNLPYCDEVSSGDGFTSIGSGGGGPSERRTMLIAHGVLASLAFVILFPAGAIAIRLASFPGVVWVHAIFQVFAYLVYIAAFGLGVYLALEMEMIDHHHPIIGVVVLICVFLQPFFGYLHHVLFKKYQSRTFWSYVHIWLGRAAVTLGIINGGLGLQWADSMNMSSRGGIISYAVIAAFVWLVWVAAMVIGERRRTRNMKDAPPKYEDGHRRGSQRRHGSRGDDTDSSDDIHLVQSRMHGHYAPKRQ